MSKQKLEGIISKSLSIDNDFWYLKLQVNPLSHTTSPADFIVLTNKKNILIECKQIDIRKTEKKNFPFTRLTQEKSLCYFEDKYKCNTSYICILLLKRRLRVSEVFLIPIYKYIYIKNSFNKKSFNINDIRRLFVLNIKQIKKGGILDLKCIK